MPKAYMMVHLELTNPEAFAAGFGSKVETVANKFGGEFLVLSGEVLRWTPSVGQVWHEIK